MQHSPKQHYRYLKDVDLCKERAFAVTFLGKREITGINKNTFWFETGKELSRRSWSSYPHYVVETIEK